MHNPAVLEFHQAHEFIGSEVEQHFFVQDRHFFVKIGSVEATVTRNGFVTGIGNIGVRRSAKSLDLGDMIILFNDSVTAPHVRGGIQGLAKQTQCKQDKQE